MNPLDILMQPDEPEATPIIEITDMDSFEFRSLLFPNSECSQCVDGMVLVGIRSNRRGKTIAKEYAYCEACNGTGIGN